MVAGFLESEVEPAPILIDLVLVWKFPGHLWKFLDVSLVPYGTGVSVSYLQ